MLIKHCIMKTIFFIISIWVSAACVKAQPLKDFENFRDDFVRKYQSFHIPALELSYAANLQHIQSPYKIQQQFDFFRESKKRLELFETLWLSDEYQADLDLMKFETSINLQRLELEKRWSSEKPAIIPVNNLFRVPHGNEWYAYFLNRWLGADVNPDEIYYNGIEEAERVKAQMEELCFKKGLSVDQFYMHMKDSSFCFNNEAQLQESFKHTRDIILQNMHLLFKVKQVQNLNIERGNNTLLAQTPGYYNENTFYYNFFDKPYNKRQVDWLFIHEAVPGHHYQSSIAATIPQSEIQQLFHYPGFAEGWAAYAETLGSELGVYQTAYSELGRCEWDLVRSVRVIIDIGINYYGWNDEKALSVWKEYIHNQDDIAMRETDRMRRWPAQVITYKYGAMLIMNWKKELQVKQGNQFDIKDFHNRLLNQGGLPFFMIRKNVFGKTSIDATTVK
jgi:uncharacterized protein (DUF885 family)